MPKRTPADRRWLAILAVAFAAALAVSWQRWVNPVIDAGREMNQPLRLASGEQLYSGVGHIYGPLSPYLHAAAYRVFGPSLNVLYADGIVCAALILAILYVLARRILDADAAGIAVLTVMWLCAFKPAGNYVFPYAFNALHGTLLALTTLAIAAAALDAPSAARFAWAGIFAGAALLAKMEMGIAAFSAGLAAAWLSRGGDTRAALARGLTFLACACGVAGAVYGAIAVRVGWRTLAFDNWLLPFYLPAPLAHFNASLSGFDHPVASLGRMALASIKLALIAAIVGAVSYLAAGPPAAAPRARRVLAVAAAVVLALGLTTGLDWDRGPFMAMPLLLIALLARLAWSTPSPGDRIVALYAIFALAQLARTMLHVRSGGAYGSFLVPVSVVLFTYLWVGPFAMSLPDAGARQAARRLVLGLLLVTAVGTAGVIGYRYRRTGTVRVSTPRGTLVTAADTGTAWNEALAFIAERTAPGDAVAVLPEGTSLVFLSGRRNPLREEIVTPGFLDATGEERAIRALEQTDTRLVLLVNRPTREFGAEAFGRDYCLRLMQWIDAHYRPCAAFGATDPMLRIGDKPFFVHAYCR
jgi:hypothetical protein